MMHLLVKLACFLGFHDWEDCDECESTSDYAIMQKCINCNKIREGQ
jgi:hypothetical protein